MEDNKMFVVDENGNQIEMEIYFTFSDERRNKSYVVYFNPNASEEEMALFASIYDEEGNLIQIEDDEEWAMVEEVIGAFDEDSEMEELEESMSVENIEEIQ